MFSVTFLWAESLWGRARADCRELVAGLCRRREATRPAGAPGGSGQASFSKARMVWGGSVSAIGVPRPPVQRELRERAARKGRPLTLRTGTSVSGSFSARIPCLDLHVPPGARGGSPLSCRSPPSRGTSGPGTRGGQSLWTLPPGRLSPGWATSLPGHPEPA